MGNRLTHAASSLRSRNWHAELRTALGRRAWPVILVDYFGTLVTRTVPPWYVKLLACRRLVDELELDATAEEIYRARVAIERELSVERVERGCDPDFRLDEVANRLAPVLEKRSAVATDTALAVLESDLAAELSVQRPDPALAAQLRARVRSSDLVVVSDFYLPQPYFGRQIEHHGLDDLFRKAFVSCEHGRTKRSGGLFAIVLDDLDADPADVLVIGDDAISDGERPRALGMTSFLRPRGHWERRRRADAAEVERDVEKEVARVLRPVDDSDLFCEMALTLYAFVRRLHRRLRAEGASEAFFVAREGLFLARLLGAYQEEHSLPASMQVAPRELMVSRRATSDEVPAEGARARQRYLSEALDFSRQRTVHIVDVGWKGTTQDQLENLLPTQIDITGLYLGLLFPTGHRETKSGVLFHNWPVRSAHLEVFAYFKSIFEVLLTAPIGSVLCYEFHDSRAVPTLENNPEERTAFEEYIAVVQHHIERRFRRLCCELRRSTADDDKLLDLAARHHARMMFRPSAKELLFFETLPFFDAGHRRPHSLGLPMDPKPPPRSSRLAQLTDPRHLVRGGGWPPLRMRAAGLGWLRFPYGWYKLGSQRYRHRPIRRPRQPGAGTRP